MPKMQLQDHFDIAKRFLTILTLLVLQGGLLEAASSSVCSQYHTRLAQRLISYQETYTKGRLFWKRRATRINYRWETYIEAVVMYECCSGYAPSANLMQFPTILAASRACTPICPSGCANGKCISPWTCDCDSGYVPTVTKRACIPHCTGDGPDGCGSHGSCLAPDKCICDKGYTFTVTRVNGKSTSGIPCIPECKLGCGKNAFCMSPNNCTCNIGYTRMNTGNWTGLNFDCEPACVPKCESNMNCFAPNRCQCDTGYVPESVHVTTGSGERPVSCSPVCHPPCQNGVCTRPGYCTCLPGYMKTSTGWQHECSPICNPPCINGSCTEPNNCECNSGYRKNAETPHVCLPHCDPPCINGTCTKPGHCECNKGYTKNSSSEICSPVCSPECQANAFCHAPNKCLCNPGYEVTNKEPHLDSTLKPFRINDTSTSNLIETSCKPVCETDCRENESCVAPNTCKCNPGYRLEAVEGNLDRCLPICEPSCVNAYCGQPDKCVCLPGYEPSHDNAFACNPVCQNDCFNATCTRPDYCECHDGYEKAPTSIGSDDLEENHENSCVPSCPEQCLDGTCIAPGQCVCEPGYVLKSTFLLHATSTEMSTTDYHANGNVTTGTNETRVQFCQPLCEPACPIGLECLSPNECEREPDVRANFTETMINSTRVINSIEDCGRNVDFLDENGKCVCRYGWKGLQCEKASLCGLVIRESFGDDEEFTTLQSTTVVNNDTMESTYDDSSDMRMISNDEDSGVLIDWEGPMCNEVCRIMTSSEISGNRSDDAVKCYLLESENVTTGVFSIRSQVLLPGSRNGTFVCFIGIDSMCNVPDSVMIGGPVDSLMGIIIGTIILLLLVVAAGFAIYYRKNRAISEDANQSMSNAAILTNTELIPLYDAEESTFI